jgi:CHAD domain-containing protein
MAISTDSVNKVVIGYLDYYFGHFVKNFEKARSEFDDEAIHQFRVSIKRIRSVFRAINKIYPGDPLADEWLDPLREMFKAGGTIRDEQVQLELIKNIEISNKVSFPLIRDLYQRKIENSIDEFLIRSKFFDRKILETFSKDISNSLAHFSGSDFQSRLYSWMDNSMEKLRHRRHKASDPFHLHRFRTRFKELSYLVEMIYDSELHPNIEKQTYQKLKSFGQQLGDWHDCYQLWHKAGEIFLATSDTHLLEESFELKKLLTPVHNSLFNEMQDRLREEGLFTLSFTTLPDLEER